MSNDNERLSERAMRLSAERMSYANIYRRRNGEFGASCDDCLDTGHHISEDKGRFTVWSVDDPDRKLCENVTRGAAEVFIAKDWRRKPE